MTAVAAWRNHRITHQNLELAWTAQRESDKHNRETQRLTEQGLVTGRYKDAVAQLGDDKLAVRIGGIYALERLMKDSPNDQPTIVEVLAAIIRRPPDDERLVQPEARSNYTVLKEWLEKLPPLRQDVQAALTVLGRRQLRDDEPRFPRVGHLLLGEAHLEGAELLGAHLEGADLSAAHLEGARLIGAHLEGAYLSKAHLEGAELLSTHLEWATLSEAHLEGAFVRGAHLEVADLYKAHFLEGALSDEQLSSASNANKILWHEPRT